MNTRRNWFLLGAAACLVVYLFYSVLQQYYGERDPTVPALSGPPPTEVSPFRSGMGSSVDAQGRVHTFAPTPTPPPAADWSTVEVDPHTVPFW